MPQIVIKGMKEEDVAAISGPLTARLSQIVEAPEDWFSVEFLPTRFYFGGVLTAHDPLIQVWWFDRGQQVQDAVARAIDQLVRERGYEQIEISFHPLETKNYYENGEHY